MSFGKTAAATVLRDAGDRTAHERRAGSRSRRAYPRRYELEPARLGSRRWGQSRERAAQALVPAHSRREKKEAVAAAQECVELFSALRRLTKVFACVNWERLSNGQFNGRLALVEPAEEHE